MRKGRIQLLWGSSSVAPGLGDSGASSQKRQEEGSRWQQVKKGSRREPLREVRPEEWGSQASVEGEQVGKGAPDGSVVLGTCWGKRLRAPRYPSFRGLGSGAGSRRPEPGLCLGAVRGGPGQGAGCLGHGPGWGCGSSSGIQRSPQGRPRVLRAQHPAEGVTHC